MTPEPGRRPSVLGVPIDVDGFDAVDRRRRATPGLLHVATVNPEYVVRARRDPAFAAALAGAEVSLADGVGVVVALRLRGVPCARATGVELAERLAAAGEPLFLLGAGPGVADDAAARLRGRFPATRVVGAWSGGSADPADDAEGVRRVAASGATAVLVAYGFADQVVWVERNRAALGAAGVRLAAGVGGALDYLSGRARRPSPLVRRLGLEWLDRLVREPARWRRQLALPVFAALAAREAVTLRRAGRGAVRSRHV